MPDIVDHGNCPDNSKTITSLPHVQKQTVVFENQLIIIPATKTHGSTVVSTLAVV